jgi:hypothetical protein
MLAAGWPPGTTEAAVQVVVRATFVAIIAATELPAVAGAAGAPFAAATPPPVMSWPEIWARLAVASTGVICGRSMNEFIAFEIPSTALAIADGRARQAG